MTILTPIARNVTRRGFLAGSAGLSLGIMLTPFPRLISPAEAQAPAITFTPDAWITIARDNRITIMSPAAEMGNGSFTTLPVIVAEELDADWSSVTVVQSPMDAKKYGNPYYYGALAFASSATVRGYYKPLRIVGAQMRRILLDAAAAKWGVDAASLETAPSVVIHKPSGRRMSYGQVASFTKPPATLPQIKDEELKPMKSFRLIGKPLPRVDVPLKVKGAAIYAMDVRVPGMIYAAVLRSPYEGGAPATLDDAKARAVPGVTDIVKLPDAVGVLGTSVEATQAAKNLLAVTWSEAPGASLDSERGLDEFAAVARDKAQRGVDFFTAGDVEAAGKSAHTTITSDYRTRYVYHAQMEPLTATASVAPDGKSAEVWIGTQAPSLIMTAVAKALDTTPDRITVHQHWIGGAYGRRGDPDVGLDAVRLSSAAGKPVKVIWSREDDIKGGKFRPMTAHHIEAGLDDSGALVSWHHRVIGESVVAAMQGQAGLDRIQGKDHILMKGSVLAHYGIPNRRAEYVRQIRGARVMTWRGVGVGHNVFASESTMDEIAHAQHEDPLEFRLAMTRQASPRATHLLERVADIAQWTRKRDGTALGIAMEEKDETLVAGIAEIALDRSSGKIKVLNFWAAIDCGVAVQPRHLAAQIEGGIIYGLGHVLREEITIKAGRVQQSNYTDYEVLRMEDAPQIKIEVVSTDNPPTGAGEDGVPLTAAAVGNAFFALTGVRLREVPMSPARVKAAFGSA